MLHGSPESRLRQDHYRRATSAYFDGARVGFAAGAFSFVVFFALAGPYLPDSETALFLAFFLIGLASFGVMALTMYLVKRWRSRARSKANEDYRAQREAETQKGIDTMLRANSNIPDVKT